MRFLGLDEMFMKLRFVVVFSLLIACFSLAQPPETVIPPKFLAAPGGLPEKPIQEAVLASLEAVEADDYAGFAILGTDEHKAALKKEWFDKMVELRAGRLATGYNVAYLGDLKKGPYTVYLWKLVFKDGGIEWLGEISWKNGKMDGYRIH